MSGRCARHPDLDATQVCARCGDFFCGACFDVEHPTVCTRCAARLPHGIPWEDARAGRWPARLARTLVAVVVRPRIAFPGPSRPWPALGFCTLAGAIHGVVAVILAGSLWLGSPVLSIHYASREPVVMGAALIVLMGGSCAGFVLAMAAQGLSFAMGLHMVGRSRGAIRFGMRASGYAQGGLLLALLLPYLVQGARWAPGLAYAAVFAWGALVLLVPLLCGRVYFAAAKGLGLRTGRALLAAAGPTLVSGLPIVYALHLSIGGPTS